MRTLAICMVVLLSFSSVVWAAEPVFVGSLRANGVVLANSIPIPDGGTVRTGDSIRTEPGALAVVASAAYRRVEIRADSEARLLGDRLQLVRGAVASSRMTVAVDRFTVQPEKSPNSWFAVARRDGRLLIAAYRGSVVISSPGEPPVVVTEGSVAQQTQDQKTEPQPDQDQPQPKEQGSKKKKGAGAAAGGGWTIGSLSHAASVALVVGAGAAVAATTAGLAVSLQAESPSPSR